MIKEICS